MLFDKSLNENEQRKFVKLEYNGEESPRIRDLTVQVEIAVCSFRTTESAASISRR